MICALLGANVLSQEYFNRNYDIAGYGLWSYGTTVLPNDSGYLIGAETCWPDNIGRTRISIVQLDFQGNQKWIKYYEQPDGSDYGFGVGYPGFFIKTFTEGYAITGNRRDPYPGWIRDRGILFRLDNNYDTLWTRLYGDQIEPCDTELLIRQVCQLYDYGFALFGGPMDYNDQRPHFTLIRTDSLGNKIWQKFYGEPPYQYYAYNFTPTSDHGFILGGLRYTYPIDQSYDPILFKTDSMGNEEWSLNLGSDYIDFAAFIDTTSDGNNIVGIMIADSMLSHDGSYRRICFTKLDNDGSILWQKKYGTSYIDNQLWSIKSLSNGKIVATGSRKRLYPEVPYRIGWILCTNYQGDSLWYREYTLVQGEHSWNFLYDIAQANDTGFIACGYINPVSPDPGPQNTWVIKVDSIGCESLDNCWVAVEESESKSIEGKKLIAFPNPSTEQITFEMDGEEILAGSLITVYDIYGKLYYEKFLTKSAVFLTLDVSTWSGGIYIARLTNMNNVVGDVKFIVE